MNIVESVAWTKYVSNVPTYREKLVIIGSSLEDKGSLLPKNEGSVFTCSDNGDTYIWSGTMWWESNAGIKEDTVGNLHELDTTEKGEIVGAINEIWALLGDLSSLDTTENTNLVGAINEVLAAIPA
jgi:hypothetical protein